LIDGFGSVASPFLFRHSHRKQFTLKTFFFVKETKISASAETVYNWHARPGAFERLKSPWEKLELVSTDDGVRDGTEVELLLRLGPFRKKWTAIIHDCKQGREFCDTQRTGPFAFWEHTHKMLPDGEHACLLQDRVEYALPFGIPGRLLGANLIRGKLARIFEYRHRLTVQDIQAHLGVKRSMKILVTGSHGLVGSALIPFLTTGGHDVLRLVRNSNPADHDISWDPQAGVIEKEQLEGLDAVVHLAGENIASRRWNAAQKGRILESRVQGTRMLCETLSKLNSPPKVLVCASAVGYFGDRSDEELDEQSEQGTGFLADVCRDWEVACDPAWEKGIRVVTLRFGVILSSAGGALAKMLLPFKLGLGGVVGSGKQYWSWIALDDVVGAILHSISNDDLNGPVNCVSPNPSTNREFTKTLGQVLKRPTIFPLPAFAARLVLGGMADELLLASAQVVPQKLQRSGYQFRFEDLESALRHTLGK
jgi:uncharacterized protein (TIGR01777 family)